MTGVQTCALPIWGRRNIVGFYTGQDTGSKTAVFLVTRTGEIWSDHSATVNLFDDYPDHEVMRAGRYGMQAAAGEVLSHEAAEHFYRYKDILEERRVIKWNEDTDGKPFLNHKNALLLAWDGLYQQGRAIEALEQKLLAIEGAR